MDIEKDILDLKQKKPAAGSADDKLLAALKKMDRTEANYFDAVDASGEVKYWGDVNVAFDLTAIENLYVTVGARISLAEDDYNDYKGEKDGDFGFLKVALGASYQVLDNLKVSASFGVQTYKEDDPSFQFGVGADFGLTDSLSLAADFRGLLSGDDDVDPVFSFLVGVQYGISSNGYVGIGFQGTTGGHGFFKDDGNGSRLKASKDDAFCWAVPIAVSCWF